MCFFGFDGGGTIARKFEHRCGINKTERPGIRARCRLAVNVFDALAKCDGHTRRRRPSLGTTQVEVLTVCLDLDIFELSVVFDQFFPVVGAKCITKSIVQTSGWVAATHQTKQI